MSTNDEVVVGGRRVSKRDCFVEAVCADPVKCAQGWAELGLSLVIEGEQAVVGALEPSQRHVVVGRKESMLEAVNCDLDSPAEVWSSLGLLMDPEELIVVRGKILTRWECYLHAFRVEPKNCPFAWFYMSTDIPWDGTKEIHGKQMKKLECFVKGIGLSPTDGRLFTYLGINLFGGPLRDNTFTMRKACLMPLTLEHFAQSGRPWKDAGLPV
jgi:hypothetical protein